MELSRWSGKWRLAVGKNGQNGAGTNGHTSNGESSSPQISDEANPDTAVHEVFRGLLIQNPDPRFQSFEEEYKKLYFEGKNRNGSELVRLLTRYASAVFEANKTRYGKSGGGEVLLRTCEYLGGVYKFHLRGTPVPGILYSGEPLYAEIEEKAMYGVTRKEKRRVLAFNPWDVKGAQIVYEDPGNTQARRGTCLLNESNPRLINEHDTDEGLTQYIHRLRYRVNPAVRGFAQGIVSGAAGFLSGEAVSQAVGIAAPGLQIAGTAVGAAVPLIKSKIGHERAQAIEEARVEATQRDFSAGEYRELGVEKDPTVSLTENNNSAAVPRRKTTLGRGVALGVSLVVAVTAGERISSFIHDKVGAVLSLFGRAKPTAARIMSHEEQRESREAALPKGVRVSFDTSPSRPDLFGDIRQRLLPHVEAPTALMSVTLPEAPPRPKLVPTAAAERGDAEASSAQQAQTPVPPPDSAPSNPAAPTGMAPDAPSSPPPPTLQVAPLAQAADVAPDANADLQTTRVEEPPHLSAYGKRIVNHLRKLNHDPRYQAAKVKTLTDFFSKRNGGLSPREQVANMLETPAHLGGVETLSQAVFNVVDESVDGEKIIHDSTVFTVHHLVEMLSSVRLENFDPSINLDDPEQFKLALDRFHFHQNMHGKSPAHDGAYDLIPPARVLTMENLRWRLSKHPNALRNVTTQLQLSLMSKAGVAQALRSLSYGS